MNSARSGIRKDARANWAENRTNAGSGFKRDAKVNKLVVMGARNRTDAGSGLEGNVEDNGLTVVDDRLAAGDDRLGIDSNRLAAEIGKRRDVDDRLDAKTRNQADAKPGNKLNADLIMNNARHWDTEDIGSIRADLIKNFNNGVLVVVLAKLYSIVSDKYVMNFSAQIFGNPINNPFGNLSLFSMALPSSFLLLLCLPQPLAIPLIVSQVLLTICLFVYKILSSLIGPTFLSSFSRFTCPNY